MVVDAKTRAKASLVWRDQVMEVKVNVKSSDEDTFEYFSHSGCKLDGAVGSDGGSRFVRFEEHECFRGFPLYRIITGAEYEIVNTGEKVKQAKGALEDVSVGDLVHSGSGVAFAGKGSADLVGGDRCSEFMAR